MTIQDLGSIGEFIAAVATLITLLYLALQIRQNTRAVRATSSREISLYFGEWHREVIRDPELRRILEKSLEDPMPDFTDAQWNEVNFLLKSFFSALEAQSTHAALDVGSSQLVDAHMRAGRSTLKWPVWRRYWEEESATGHWSDSFLEAMEKGDAGQMLGVRSINKQNERQSEN